MYDCHLETFFSQSEASLSILLSVAMATWMQFGASVVARGNAGWDLIKAVITSLLDHVCVL